MKRVHRIAVLVMTVCLILGTMAVSVYADYEHELTVSPGNGKFSEGNKISGKSITVTDGLTGTITVGGKKVTVTPPDDDHFVTGIKVAGKDNASATVGTVTLKDEDVDYVVSYGLKSNMVEYTVRYIDLATNTAMDTETHFGVIGEKPVVTFKYFDGYAPANAYAITQTLTGDPSANVIEFTYNQVDAEGNVVNVIINDGGAANAGAGGAGGAGGAAGAGGAGGAGGADGANIGDGAVPQAGPADLQDNDVPTTDNPDGTTAIDDNESPATNWGTIAGGAALVAAIAAAVALLLKRRKEAEEADE